MRPIAVMILAGSCWLMASANVPIASAGKEKKADQPPGELQPLEKLLAEALAKSPDVKVAQAKVRLAQAALHLAEAELELARALVKAQVGAAHADVRAARAVEEEAHARHKRAEALFRQNVISQEELVSAALTYAKVKNERLAAEERLKLFLLGAALEKSEPKQADTKKRP